MDSDDGLLLNFSEEFQPSNRAPRKVNIVKGGRWKDRRKQQLSNQGRGRTNKNRATTGSNAVPIEPRSSKINDEYSNEFSSENVRKRSANDKSSSQKRIATEARGEFGGKNNSYVSSLFTSNKSNTKLVPSGVNGDNNEFPSNAPLKDSATFSGLGLNEKLCAFLNDVMRFKAPTEIQSSVIPKILLSKRDLFVRAQTGSGKTLSILLPILNSLMLGNDHKLDRTSGLFALILTPTRELASQIYGVLETLSRCCHHIVPGIVIGGEKKKSEKARFRKGVNILVGTPGRLADHLENTKSLDSGQLRWLVLDEGDRLIELGFEETITQITNSITQNSRIHETASWEFLPKKRINILCSATMQNVDKLGSIVLDKPEMINVGLSRSKLHNEDIQLVPDQLIQEILVVPPKLRIVTLTSLLKQISKAGETKKTIVFFSCSDSVNFHFSAFTREGRILKDNKTAQDIEDESEITTKMGPLVSSNSSFFKLHGSLSQRDRIFTLNAFINSDSDHSILLCTDVASRGLDLPNITNVIEYDAPFTVEDHLHRIGRSARVGKKGEASLFLLPGSEESYVDGKIRAVHSHQENLHIGNLEDVLKDGFAVAEETVPKFKANTRRKEGDWDFHATTWHLNMERWLLEDTSAHELAAKAFTSHIRAYATHLSSERIYFNVKELHLGHIAKSFGLREAPRSIVKATEGKNKKSQKSNSENKNDDPRKKLFYMARLAEKSNNEFNY